MCKYLCAYSISAKRPLWLGEFIIECCPKVYIGQIGRRLSQRLTEHKRAVMMADFNSSALAEHAWSAGHPVDWENTHVLSNCSDYHSRLFQEAIFIRSTSHTPIRDTGTLPHVYDDPDVSWT